MCHSAFFRQTAAAGWLAALLAALAAGCGRSSPHDDHLEHHTPAHKPAEFSAAVREVQRRATALAGGDAAANEPDLHELLDILRWLPELAGDSDLPEADWNRVSETAGQLIALYEPLQIAHGRGQKSSFPAAEQIEPLLSELRAAAHKAAELQPAFPLSTADSP